MLLLYMQGCLCAAICAMLRILRVELCKPSMFPPRSINLLDSWATPATRSMVHFHHDGVDDAFKLLLFGLELILLGQLVFVQPVKGFCHSCFDLLLVSALAH